VIAGEPVPPLEAHALARPQHESPALLGWVALDAARSEASAEGAQIAEQAAWMEHAQKPRDKASGLVRPQRRVGEEWTLIARDLAEGRQVIGPAGSHDHQLAAPPMDLRQDLGETSDLLVAEDSAEVADEGEHDGPALPLAAERHGVSALVEHSHGRQRRGQGMAHGRHSTAGAKKWPAGSASATIAPAETGR